MITLGKKCSLEPTDKHSEQDNGYLSTRRGKPAIALKQHRRNGAQRWGEAGHGQHCWVLGPSHIFNLHALGLC